MPQFSLHFGCLWYWQQAVPALSPDLSCFQLANPAPQCYPPSTLLAFLSFSSKPTRERKRKPLASAEVKKGGKFVSLCCWGGGGEKKKLLSNEKREKGAGCPKVTPDPPKASAAGTPVLRPARAIPLQRFCAKCVRFGDTAEFSLIFSHFGGTADS